MECTIGLKGIQLLKQWMGSTETIIRSHEFFVHKERMLMSAVAPSNRLGRTK
jgi:hypothetical protein